MSRSRIRLQRGLSLVETMVGVALSLIVVSGVLKLFVDYLDVNRRLLIDTRLQQELRTTGELIARDMRRASSVITVSGSTAAAKASYSYATYGSGNTVTGSSSVGIRLNSNILEMSHGQDGWQDLTDPGTVKITRFSITPIVREVSLGHLCAPVCTNASATCPSLRIRSYDIALQARSTTDSSVVRETRESVRVRNDETATGACP